MLYSVVVELEPAANAILPPTQGHHAHAAFLSLVSSVDRALGDRLHAPGPKPFTVSPLLGRLTPEEGGVRVHAGATYLLRFTLLEDEPFAGLLAGLVEGGVRPIRLAPVSFAVKRVHTQSETSPWARAVSFARLLEGAVPRPSIDLEFLSPTAFSFGGGQSVILPEPRLVFGGLANRWNAYSPAKLEPPVVEALREGVLVSRYRLETKMLRFGRFQQVGFVGTCSFEVRSREPGVVRAANALADFAFFSGVGHKTTMGMGQARRALADEPRADPPLLPLQSQSETSD